MKRNRLLLILLLNLAGPVHAQTNYLPYTFITLAGSTTAGSADGYGVAAGFGSMRDVALDKAGNLYVADCSSTVRRITPDGLVTTIAGVAGKTGTNDGIGSQARFGGDFSPQGVAVDPSGRLFVADFGSHSIRMLTPTSSSGLSNWLVATIAGTTNFNASTDGTNRSAHFGNPRGITVDAFSNLFITDYEYNNIRKMTPQGTNWVVTSLAGLASTTGAFADGTNTNARFKNPTGISVDAAGNLYVGDDGNNCIREITPVGTNWVVITIAGNTTAGFADGVGTNALFHSPNNAVMGGDGCLYVSEYRNSTIRRLVNTGTNWQVGTVAGVPGVSGSANGTGNSARFNGPIGLAVDMPGNLYVSDVSNFMIRKGWLATNPPICNLSVPVLANNQAHFELTVVTGPVTNYALLLQAGSVSGPWTTNTGVTLTTNVQNVSYRITAPNQTGQSGFFRAQVQ